MLYAAVAEIVFLQTVCKIYLHSKKTYKKLPTTTPQLAAAVHTSKNVCL